MDDPSEEIGALVDAYNGMIDELENSATLLAKSEREQAWREMAKQVAHEIKNPLTPIQLTIDRLKNKYSEMINTSDKNNFNEKLVEKFNGKIIHNFIGLT